MKKCADAHLNALREIIWSLVNAKILQHFTVCFQCPCLANKSYCSSLSNYFNGRARLTNTKLNPNNTYPTNSLKWTFKNRSNSRSLEFTWCPFSIELVVLLHLTNQMQILHKTTHYTQAHTQKCQLQSKLCGMWQQINHLPLLIDLAIEMMTLDSTFTQDARDLVYLCWACLFLTSYYSNHIPLVNLIPNKQMQWRSVCVCVCFVMNNQPSTI